MTTSPPASPPREETRRFTLRYVLALAAVGLLSIAGQALIEWSLHQQEGDSRVVNLAGRQRMLSQRLTKSALLLVYAEAPPARAAARGELEATLQLWRSSHAALKARGGALELPGANSAEIAARFAKIEPLFDSIASSAAKLLGEPDAPAGRAALKTLLAAEAAFLAEMDAIVFRYDDEARARVTRLRALESLLLAVTLLVLLAEGLLVFRPAVRLIGRQIAGLREAALELAAARDAAERANRAKSRFLANISHELRTPLHAIIGMTELAQTADQPSERREFLTAVGSAAESLLGLPDDLLDLSRIAAGKLELHAEPLELRTAAAATLHLLSPLAARRGVKLELEVEPNVPAVIAADRLRLQQVLVNLVTNGIKFTERGEVRLSIGLRPATATQLERLQFSVLDQGIGIAPEDQQRIFEAFTQVEQNPGKPSAGVGLGLAITAQLVQLWSGRVWVESEPGHGSRFAFTLPLVRPAALPSTAPSSEDTTAPPRRALRVLVVEDTAVNQRIAQEVLSRAGHTVTIVERGEAALYACRRTSFDALLLDVQLPGMDGLAVIGALREQECELGRQRTPVIALTAHAGQEDRRRCLAAGMDSYLSKPVRARDLLAALDQVVIAGAGLQSAEVPPPAEPSSSEPLSLAERRAAILERLDGRHELFTELSDLIQAETPGLIEQIQAGLASGNLRQVCVAAHRFRGMVAIFEAEEAVAAALALETAAEREDAPAAAENFAELQRAIPQMLADLERLATAECS